MIRPKNETEDLLHSITKNCEKPNKQTHTKPQEALEFKLTQPRETFSFKPSPNLGFDSRWLFGLTKLEVCHHFSNVTEETIKF